MDSPITAAAHALAAGDPLGALNRVALRDDAPALALRGSRWAARRSRSREGTAAYRGARPTCYGQTHAYVGFPPAGVAFVVRHFKTLKNEKIDRTSKTTGRVTRG
jgi:hypothetical protein